MFHQVSFVKIVEEIVRIFLGQDSDILDTRKFQMKIRTQSMIFMGLIQIIILTQSASILTKAFNGLLLNTYFNVKYVPIVQTLQDVNENNDLKIMTIPFKLDSIHKGYNISAEILKNLKRRATENREKDKVLFENVYKETSIIDLIMGKHVIIGSSTHMNFLLDLYGYLANYFYVSEQKYQPVFDTLLIHKKHIIARQLKFM